MQPHNSTSVGFSSFEFDYFLLFLFLSKSRDPDSKVTSPMFFLRCIYKTRNSFKLRYICYISDMYSVLFVILEIVPWGCMGIDTVTCGDLKNLYKNQSCCGQALKHVSLCGEGTVWNGRQCSSRLSLNHISSNQTASSSPFAIQSYGRRVIAKT